MTEDLERPDAEPDPAPDDDTPPPTRFSAPKAGEVIALGPGAGSYTLVRRAGTGSMAEVWLAHRSGVAGSAGRGFEKHVALKRILPARLEYDERKAAGYLRAFLDEARLAGALTHPAIAQVYDLLPRGDGTYYLVMEYVPGRTLRDALDTARDKGRPFSEAFACHVIMQLAEALHCAYTARGPNGKPLRIVHRDVAPKNVMLSVKGEVKLLDFGVAYSILADRDRTEAGVVKGTYRYMSPEQVKGIRNLDARSDIFSLGLILCELLAGRSPFDCGSRWETLTGERIAVAAPGDVRAVTANLAPELAGIIERVLARRPQNRFPNGALLATALRKYMLNAGLLCGPAEIAAELRQLKAAPRLPVERQPSEWKPHPSSRFVSDAVDAFGVEPFRLAGQRVADACYVLKFQLFNVARRRTEPITRALRPKLRNVRAAALRVRRVAGRRLNLRTLRGRSSAIRAGAIGIAVCFLSLLVIQWNRGDAGRAAGPEAGAPAQLRAGCESAGRPWAFAPLPAAAPPFLAKLSGEPLTAAATRPEPRRPAKTVAAVAIFDPATRPEGYFAPAGGTAFAEPPAPAAAPRDAASLPRGTLVLATLTAPVDPMRPGTVVAVVAEDVVDRADVVIPKGSSIRCSSRSTTGDEIMGCEAAIADAGAVHLKGVTAFDADRLVGILSADSAADAILRAGRRGLTPEAASGAAAHESFGADRKGARRGAASGASLGDIFGRPAIEGTRFFISIKSFDRNS